MEYFNYILIIVVMFIYIYRDNTKILKLLNLIQKIIISIYIIPFAFRLDGHDYSKYIEIIGENKLINDLPLSYLIIKNVYNLVGIGGFAIINIVCFNLILLIFEKKFIDNKKYLTYSLLPIIFFFNDGVLLQIGSSIKNNIGFVVVCLSQYLNGLFWDVSLLSLLALSIHIPSFFYLLFYKILINRKLKYYCIIFFSGFIIITLLMFTIGFFGEYAINTILTLRHNYIHAINIGFNPDYSFGKWFKYIIYCLSIMPFMIRRYLKSRDRDIIVYSILLMLPYIPFFAIEFRWRLLVLSWFPLINLLNYIDEKSDERFYLLSLALFNLIHLKELFI